MSNQQKPIVLDSCFQLLKMRIEGDASDDKELYIRLCMGYMSLFKSTIEYLYQRYSDLKELQCRVIEYAENTKVANYMYDVDNKFEHTQDMIDAFAKKLGIPPFGLKFQDKNGKPLIVHDYISCKKALKVRDIVATIPEKSLKDLAKRMPCFKKGREEVYSRCDDGDYLLLKHQAEEQFYEDLKRNNLREDYEILKEMETKKLFTTKEVIKLLEKKAGKSICDSYFSRIKSEVTDFPDPTNPKKVPHLWKSEDIPKIIKLSKQFFNENPKEVPIRKSAETKKVKK